MCVIPNHVVMHVDMVNFKPHNMVSIHMYYRRYCCIHMITTRSKDNNNIQAWMELVMYGVRNQIVRMKLSKHDVYLSYDALLVHICGPSCDNDKLHMSMIPCLTSTYSFTSL